MQPYGLTIEKFLDHAAKWAGSREVVSVDSRQAIQRARYADLRVRSNRLSGALGALGLEFGDRIATLAWNTLHHFEFYYATMAAGWVCHTLNPRYTLEQLVAIINEAEDRALAVAADLVPLLSGLLPRCPTIRHVIVMDGAVPESFAAGSVRPTLWAHDALLEQLGAVAAWGGFPEETPAGLCYTSGTMGPPKGVLYTHRSNYLHTLHALQASAFALTDRDTVLAAVPMFHANGWGLPFSTPAVGANLVLPGPHLEGASLTRLLRDERVTVAVGVHTVWTGVIEHLDAVGGQLPDLKRIVIGGSQCPEVLIRRMEDRLGVRVQRSWGMTEMSPLGTIAAPDAGDSDASSSGRPPLGVDLKLMDANGNALSNQRETVGRLRAKGASVLDKYYKSDVSALDAEGYLDTGDLASIDARGNVVIRGRSKDLIKSGGEWINPATIEEIIGRHPGVGLAAVIGRPDEKWGERPVLVVQPRPGRELHAEELLAFLEDKVAHWWIPDDVEVVRAMPLAATGKIDRRSLRAKYGNGTSDVE
jgi:fatty-acyl-CoA synthase